MSEEQIQEALGQQTDIDQEVIQDQVEDQHQEEELNLSSKEQTAWDQGWRPEDQFEGNPDNWKTAGEYVLFGEMQKQLNDVKAESRKQNVDFETRLAGVNQYHEGRLKAELDELKVQQRAAVEVADTDEFDRLQRKIDSQEPIQQTVPSAPQQSATIADWEARNPWVNDPSSEKGQEAIALYNAAANRPGATEESALAYVDNKLSQLYPEEQQQVNPRREMPTMTEQSTQRTTRQRGNKELTMNDLTAAEKSEYEKFGRMMFKDEKSFLKTVADARKA